MNKLKSIAYPVFLFLLFAITINTLRSFDLELADQETIELSDLDTDSESADDLDEDEMLMCHYQLSCCTIEINKELPFMAPTLIIDAPDYEIASPPPEL